MLSVRERELARAGTLAGRALSQRFRGNGNGHALLRVFERFPDEDGAGVFWSIVHGLEALSGYEKHLVAAVQRHPTDFTVIMVRRLINAGSQEIDGVKLSELVG